MFEWTVKEDIKAANAIFLGETREEEGRPFKARFLQAGLVKYDFGVCLLKKETIDKFVNTFIECPVIINHKDDISKRDKKGIVKNIWFSPEDSWFWCSGYIDEDAADKVEDGFNVSCQYRITEYSNNDENKLHNGNPYDKEILNGVFEHLAIVKNPRYEDAYIAVNAIMATNEDQWITIGSDEETGRKGKHILVREGQTKEEAIKEKFQEWASKDKKQGKLFDSDKYVDKDYYSKKKEKQEKFSERTKEIQEKEKTEKSEKKNKVIQDYIDGKITPEELEKAVPDMPFNEWLNLADKRLDKRDKENKEPEEKQSDIYTNLLSDSALLKHLRDSVKAQKAENPDAKIGDTVIDSDRFISNYSQKLSTKEYNEFNFDKAEDLVFEKLKEFEKEAGFKSDEKETISAKLSDMLAPKQKKEQRPIKLDYMKQTREGYALYVNPKTKTMYMEKDGKFYDMKYREVNKEFDIDKPQEKETQTENNNYNKFHKSYYEDNKNSWSFKRGKGGNYSVTRTNEDGSYVAVKGYKKFEDLDKYINQFDSIKLDIPNRKVKGENKFQPDLKTLESFKDKGFEVSEQYDDGYNTKYVLKKKAQNSTKLKNNETSKDFVKRILETKIEKYKPTTQIIDWGSLKGRQQGKRSNGMVMGAMGDVTLQGKKEYKSILGGLPEYENIKDDFGSDIEGEQMKMAYLKAREAGFNQEESERFAYSIFEPENLLYKKLKASNSFIAQFKDMLYETLAEGIFNKLGEKHAK